MATKRLPAAERRKQLLRASIRVFARRGYHGATTRQIAEEAQVAEALLYRYFPSKRDLFTSAVERTAERLISGLQAVVEAHDDNPRACLGALLHFYRTTLERNAELAKMVFLVSAELDDPEVQSIYLPYQEQALQILQQAILRWQHAGKVAASLPPRATAWIIMGCFQVVALMKHTGRLQELNVNPALQLVDAFLRNGDTEDDGSLHAALAPDRPDAASAATPKSASA